MVFMYDFGKGVMFVDVLLCYVGYESCSVELFKLLCEWLWVLNECCDFVLVVVCEYGNLYCVMEMGVVVLVWLFECSDVLCKLVCFVELL